MGESTFTLDLQPTACAEYMSVACLQPGRPTANENRNNLSLDPPWTKSILAEFVVDYESAKCLFPPKSL